MGYILRDEILTAVLTEIQVYWCMTLCWQLRTFRKS